MSTGQDERAARRSAFTTSRADRDRTLEGIRDLETALARAASGATWFPQVVAGLDALEAAMDVERRELNRPDALLAMVAAEHPRRFGSRARNLREQYDDIIRQLASLRSQLEAHAISPAIVSDLRHRAGWIIRALHHCRAQQTDLVYDALELDLGEHDGRRESMEAT